MYSWRDTAKNLFIIKQTTLYGDPAKIGMLYVRAASPQQSMRRHFNIVFFCSCAALPFVTRTHRQQPHSDSVALSNQPTTTTTESSVMPISCS